MRQYDQNRLSMWRAVRQHLDAHSRTWNSNIGFARASAGLTAAIDNAKAALDRQAAGTLGVSSERKSMQGETLDAVLAIARCARAYAIDAGDTGLLAAIAYSRGVLKHYPQNALTAQLRTMVRAAQAAGSVLADYGVAEGACEAALEKIRLMEETQSSVRRAITLRKAVTKGLQAIMKAGSSALTKMDNLAHVFETADPAFVSGYRTARGVVHAGTRHKGDTDASAA